MAVVIAVLCKHFSPVISKSLLDFHEQARLPVLAIPDVQPRLVVQRQHPGSMAQHRYGAAVLRQEVILRNRVLVEHGEQQHGELGLFRFKLEQSLVEKRLAVRPTPLIAEHVRLLGLAVYDVPGDTYFDVRVRRPNEFREFEVLPSSAGQNGHRERFTRPLRFADRRVQQPLGFQNVPRVAVRGELPAVYPHGFVVRLEVQGNHLRARLPRRRRVVVVTYDK